MMPETKTVVGVDLGQTNDYTALCVTERAYVPVGRLVDGSYRDHRAGRTVRAARQPVGVEYRVRHLERPPLGTPYPDVVERVIEVCKAVGGKPALCVDQTGVGRPVVDALRRRLVEEGKSTGLKVALIPVTITGGDAMSRVPDGYRVPKRDLVSSALVAMQNGTLKIAEALALRDVLTKELLNFKVRISISSAHDSYEAWREGDHDDLVLALSLTTWLADRMPRETSVLLPGVVAA